MMIDTDSQGALSGNRPAEGARPIDVREIEEKQGLCIIDCPSIMFRIPLYPGSLRIQKPIVVGQGGRVEDVHLFSETL
jgi:hypothetical protein